MYQHEVLERWWRPLTGDDYMIGRKMADYWCNFAKTGNPNGDGNPEWLPYTEDNKRALQIDNEIKMIDPPSTPLLEFLKKHELEGL